MRALPSLLAAATALLAVTSAGAQFGGARSAERVLLDSAEFRERLVPDRPFVGPDGHVVLGHRCATAPLTAAETAAAEARMAMTDAIVGEDSPADLLADPRQATKRVRVYVHVVHAGSTGNVSDDDIQAQMKVLNDAFRTRGFRFRLKAITRTDKRRWFRNCDSNNVYERMTDALAVRPKRSLNLYVCKPSGGILGFAHLPGSSVTGTNQDGAVILFSSLPNGSASPYNLGDTATHEVGHYLGLLHTFQGGCGDRDLVADTPAEASPAFGCPIDRDSCKGGGPDPIFNFMDYTDDSCMNTFTKKQARRMQRQVRTLRPGL